MHADTTLSRPASRGGEYAARSPVTWPIAIGGLVLLDALAILAAFALAYVIRFRTDLPIFREGTDDLDFYATVVVWALPAWLAIFAASRLYDRRVLFSGYREYARVGSACSAGALAIVVISFLYDTPSIARAWLLLVWVSSIALVWTARFAARRIVRRLRAAGHLLTPTLIVGTDGEGHALAAQLSGDPSSGVNLLGFVEGSTAIGIEEVDGRPVLGGLADLEQIVRAYGVDQIVIATGALARDDMLDLYRRFAHREDVDLRMSSGLFEILATGVRVQHAGAVPLLTVDRVRITGVDAILKSTLDYTLATTALLLLSPLLAVIAVVVKLDTGGPIVYRRRVLGRSGKVFDAFKFCTMIADRRAEKVEPPFPDRRRADKTRTDPRVTRRGKFLRQTSLDELPQLVNVLRGEMSLIGPRMVSNEEIGRYGKWQLNLLTVKLGITGPWQVRGRSDIPYEERVRLSTEYIRNYSIWLDLQILLQTIPVVLRARGAY